MATNTISFTKTPQASDDTFTSAETGLTEDSTSIVYLDVMANDLGGNAKSLWSVDNGINNTGAMNGYVAGDLLTQDTARAEGVSQDTSLHGAKIWITADGRIGYDSSTLDASFKAHLQSLSAGEDATDSFTYAIRLGNGTLSWATATVHFAGLNDSPTIVAGSTQASGRFGELPGVTGSGATDGVGGTIAFADLDLHDTHTVTQSAPTLSWSGGALNASELEAVTAASHLVLTEADSTGTGSGSVTWSSSAPDSAFDFLAANETLTVSYDVTITDNHGASATQTVAVTVTGANDAPMIVAGSTHASAGLNELPNVTGSTATDSTGGTIAFTDADLDDSHALCRSAPRFSWSGGALSASQIQALTAASHLQLTETDSTGTGSGSVAWTYSAGDGAFDFLAAGETLTVSYDVTITDSQNASVTQTVTATITGANDAPELQNVSGATQNFDQTNGLTLSGTMAFSDVDLDDKHTITVTPLASGYVGMFTPVITTDSTGSGQGTITATYTLTPAQFMAAGGNIPAEQDYQVTIDDGHGATSTQVVKIPLAQILSGIGHGNNNPPVIVGGDTSASLVDNPFLLIPNPNPGPQALMASGRIFFTNPGGGDVTASVDPTRFILAGHFISDGTTSQKALGLPIVGTWSFDNVSQYDPATGAPGEIDWVYSVPEVAARSLAQGEFETLLFPVTLSADGGQATENIVTNLIGTGEVPFLLPPNITVNQNTDLTPYLLPPDQLQHMQSQAFTIDDQSVAGGFPTSHSLGGTISWIDPDALDRPNISLQLQLGLFPASDPLVQSISAKLASNFHYSFDSHGAYDTMGSPAAFGNITWSYQLPDSALDFISQGMTIPLTATFTVGEIVGSAQSQLTIDLVGHNLAPVIKGPTGIDYVVDLSQFGGGPNFQSISGNFGFSDPNYFDSHQASVFDSNHVRIDGLNAFFHAFTLADGSFDSQGSGTVGWFYTINPSAHVPGTRETFDIVVSDNFGATTDYTVNVDYVSSGGSQIIYGRPTFEVTNPDTVTQGDQPGPQPVTLNVADYVTINDPNPADTQTPYVPGTLTLVPDPLVNPNLFQIDQATGTISYDRAAFDYLPAGQDLTARFAFQSASGLDSSQQEIDLTIHGTNDQPVITAFSPFKVSYAGGLDGTTTVSGTISFTDADLVTATSPTDPHIPVQFAWPSSISTPYYVPIIPHLDTQLLSDSNGGSTGQIGWTLTVDNSQLLMPFRSSLPANLDMPIPFNFSVGVGDGAGTASQPLLYTETLITGGQDGGVINGTIGNDIIIAVAGDNQLVTNGGSDLLTGYGNDTFVVNSLRGVPTITNFGLQDAVDLTNILYSDQPTLHFSENSSGTAGRLTVSDGTNTNNIVLMGSYTGSDFVMASDGHGGTLVSDPQAPNTNQALLAQPKV